MEGVRLTGSIILPRILEVEVTRACNLGCYHCNRRSRQKPAADNITTDSVRRLLKDIRAFKWDRIRILGGEPTLYHGLIYLCYELRYTSPSSIIEVWTNGYRGSVSRLPDLPHFVRVVNSEKLGPAIGTHVKCDLAPRDYGLLVELSDSCYQKTCYTRYANEDIDKVCGFVYTNGGYYVCGGGSAIDNLLGLKLGYSTIEDLINDKGMKQFNVLCQYCGESEIMQRYAAEHRLPEWESPTWKRVFERGN